MTLPEFVKTDVDLGGFSTLALPAWAAHYAKITSPDQLLRLSGTKSRRFVLGGGSNIVLTGNFEGLVLHMAIAKHKLAGEDADAWYVRAGAGEDWHEFVQWTLAQGRPGLENLSLIPGTVGAAPIQNIGAYGLEVCERLHSLKALDMQTGESVCFDRAACRFGYRDSVFKQQGWHRDGRMVITDVTFRLPKLWQPLTRYADLAAELDARNTVSPTAQDVAAAVTRVRERKLPNPVQLPNAGSFFQNPVVDAAMAERLAQAYPSMPRYVQDDGRVKLAAGWLIEQAGWKGRDLGPVGMYEKQAVVLVNRGTANGVDVAALTRAVQGDVGTKFGVELTPEPVFV